MFGCCPLSQVSIFFFLGGGEGGGGGGKGGGGRRGGGGQKKFLNSPWILSASWVWPVMACLLMHVESELCEDILKKLAWDQ